VKIYSVTTVLRPFQDFRGVPRGLLETAGKRGRAVHAASASFARNLWVNPLPPEWNGYFLSFKSWFQQYVDRVFFVEKRMECKEFGFTGQGDLGVKLIDGRDMVVDLKTPLVESPTWKAQLAAYRFLARLCLPYQFEGMSLILHPGGGSAKAVVYDYADDDFAAFLSALNAYRYFKK